jgi:hypothetical protein
MLCERAALSFLPKPPVEKQAALPLRAEVFYSLEDVPPDEIKEEGHQKSSTEGLRIGHNHDQDGSTPRLSLLQNALPNIDNVKRN